MPRADIRDLQAFLAIVRERSFTRAAAQLGVSQSALSHTLRSLEARLGLRLLTRTTRSVAPTQAGERLVQAIGPRFEELEDALASLSDLRDRPSGTIRLSVSESATRTILTARLASFLRAYPDVSVELVVDNALTDIVSARCDAGIRAGEQVARDMVAVPVGPPIRMAVVATPSYFAASPPPVRPQDLTRHSCINLRLATRGDLYAWEFEKAGRALRVRVEGQLIVNSPAALLRAALYGMGLVYVQEDHVGSHMEDGTLRRVLADWCPPFPGLHLYYPSRRQPTPAFRVLIDALRYPGRTPDRISQVSGEAG